MMIMVNAIQQSRIAQKSGKHITTTPSSPERINASAPRTFMKKTSSVPLTSRSQRNKASANVASSYLFVLMMATVLPDII